MKKQHQALTRAVAAFFSMTLLSRILGLCRDVVIGFMFGATGLTDAFWIAFKFPNLFRRLFAEGSFVQAVVPVLTDYQQHQSTRDVMGLIANVLGCLLMILLPLTCLVCLAAPWVMRVIAPGFVGNSHFNVATDLLRLVFPYLALISITALASAVLNSYQRFAASAAAPILLNICFIVAAIASVYFTIPIMALGWGVLIAGFLQCTLLLYCVARLKLLAWPKWHFSHPGVKRVMRLMLPTIVGSSAMQINILINNMIASLLPMGSITWLYFADRLVQLPLALIGVSLSTAMLPALSKDHVTASHASFSDKLSWGFQVIFVFALPATIGLALLAKPMVMTLFYHGQFNGQDVLATSQALQIMVIGLPAFILYKLLTTICYARQDSKTPLKIALLSIVVNVILSLLLYQPLAHVGLALASSMSAWVSVISLVCYQRVLIVMAIRQLARLILSCCLCVGVMSYALIQATASMNWQLFTFWQRGMYLAVIMMLAMALYFALLWLCKRWFI